MIRQKLDLTFYFQIWNFLGFLLLSATGICSLIVWTAAKSADNLVIISFNDKYKSVEIW
jgi:hypothetical protein